MQMIRSGFLVLLTAFFLMACTDSADGPREVAKQYVESVLNHDVDAMMATVDLAEISSEETAELKAMLATLFIDNDDIPELSTIKKITYANPTYNNDKSRATVRMVTDFKDSNTPSDEEDFALVNTEKGWKITQ